jgi:hypothetical protein
MDTRHKVNLIILFAAGNFTVACSIIRMLQIKQVQKDGNNSMLLLWGSVEMNIGVSPFFYPQIRRFSQQSATPADFDQTALTCLPALKTLF